LTVDLAASLTESLSALPWSASRTRLGWNVRVEVGTASDEEIAATFRSSPIGRLASFRKPPLLVSLADADGNVDEILGGQALRPHVRHLAEFDGADARVFLLDE